MTATVEAMRARLVFEAARRQRPATVEALRGTGRLALWREDIFAAAVAQLVEDGLLAEKATGELIVRPRRRSA